MSLNAINDENLNQLITANGYRILGIDNERLEAKTTRPAEGYATFCRIRINTLQEILRQHANAPRNPQLRDRTNLVIINRSRRLEGKLLKMWNNPPM